MQTTTMEELAERLYTAEAQANDWVSAETLGPIPAWSDTQRTVKNAWYIVAQEAIDAGSEAPPPPPPPILFEASAGESTDPKAIEILGPSPQWAALPESLSADWAAVGEVAADVMEDLRRDVKPLPLKKKMHPGDVPPTLPGGGTPPTPQTLQVTLSSADLLALSTAPKLLVPVTAGTSLEFQSATAAYTFGTIAYADAGGVAVLQIRAGAPPVSADVPASFLTGAASSTASFTSNGAALAPDQPLTLILVGGVLTAGDGMLVLDVTYAVHTPPAADEASVEAAPAVKATAVQASAHAKHSPPTPPIKKANHK